MKKKFLLFGMIVMMITLAIAQPPATDWVTFTPTGPTTGTATWDNSPQYMGAGYWYVAISTSSTFPGWGGLGGAVPMSSMDFTGLTPNTTYYVYVSSVETSGWSWRLPTRSNAAQTYWYSGGIGTSGNPYQISSKADLETLSTYVNAGTTYATEYFQQTTNIDFETASLTPIGSPTNSFRGTYDGNGYTISNFSIISGGNYMSLFANLNNGTIKNLGVTGATINAAGNVVAALVGHTYLGTIQDCYVSGCSITGSTYVAGLVGSADSPNTITRCYVSGGTVHGNDTIGGLVGQNAGTISNCYSSTALTATSGGGNMGGLVGKENQSSGASITNCYSSGAVGSGNNVGGLVGYLIGTNNTVNSFWDTETSGQSSSAGGTGKTTAEMKMQSTFTDWDFTTTPIWNINSTDNNGYPHIEWQLPLPIISYSTPPIYIVETAIVPLTPSNSGGAVPAATPGTVSTFAGSGTGGYHDGSGTDAQFAGPGGITLDGAGNFYIADNDNRIRKITSGGEVTTFAGSGDNYQFADGTGILAKFYAPQGVATDASGNVYVADSRNNRIRKITPVGVVTTLAGNSSNGSNNGTGAAASFSWPSDVAVDASGNVYVADLYNHMIRKITPAGVVTTLAGSISNGYHDGTGTSAQFYYPMGIAVDGSGNVYVAEYNNNRIRKITSAGVVTTFAGSGANGSMDGTGINAIISQPIGIAIDAAGNLYVSEQENKIRKITPAGVVTTLAGIGTSGSANGIGASASFKYPANVDVDNSGNIYVADQNNNLIRKISQEGYSISPSLPTGLSFDATTGTISGTPTVASASTSYTITGTNSTGSSTTTISIEVVLAPSALVLTGSTICTSPGGNGTITSSASENLVDYQLYDADNTPIQSSKAGTGAGLTWTGLVAGNGYYVIGTNAVPITSTSNIVDVSTTSGTVWTGVNNSNWSNLLNWSCGVPTNTDNIVIPSAGVTNFPIVDNIFVISSGTPATCKDLTINSGATLTIGAGNALTVYGVTTNNGTFTIKANVAGTASFINNGTIGGAGSFNAEKYLTGTNTAGTPDGRYWYFSSPVNGALSNIFNIAGGSIVKNYYEPSHAWQIVSNATMLVAATGYYARVLSDGNVTFSGTSFFTGDYSPTIIRSGTTDEKRGYNLLGNPYPSFLNWDAANPDPSISHVSRTIWYRTANASDVMVFDTYNETLGVGTNNNGSGAVTKYIPPSQSFWVKEIDEANPSGIITFSNSMRSHRTNIPLKVDQSLNAVLRLKIANGINTDETVIYFNADATNAFDLYDSPKMFAEYPDLPQIYTVVDNEKVVFNGMQDIPSNPSVALGFKTSSANQFTITAFEISGFDALQPIFIRDNFLNITQDLRANPTYSFYSSSIDTTGRFEILFTVDITTSVNDIADDKNILVFADNDQINIILESNDTPGGFVEVYNTLGQMICKQEIVDKATIIRKALSAGTYVVKVQTGKQVVTRKIISAN
jgi:sugar lactone lactonase YvrE